MKKKNLWILIIVLFLFLFGFGLFYFYITDFSVYSNAYFGIETYHSLVDMDEDGIDDQIDILNSVRDYISTKPKYKSKYYGTGYPDDGFGVCTDVVAFGFLGAGYDLRELLYQDVLENRDVYDIEVVDKNIDFRRVLNLNTYFKRNAIVLTNDIYNLEEWQGGDVVVFSRHIGIVSDKRDRRGIPFVIHHANPYQLRYEENILEKSRGDIIGHYRIS